MREAAAVLGAMGAHDTLYVSLADFGMGHEPDFFGHLYQAIAGGLLSESWSPPLKAPTSAFEFQYALLDLVHAGDRNLALFVDDLELAYPNLVAALLGALRAVFSTRVDRPGARFQAVVCGSLSLDQVALEGASRFESVSELVMVGDLDQREIVAFVREVCGKADMEVTPDGLRALIDQTGGDRLLIEGLASVLCTTAESSLGSVAVTMETVNQALSRFLDDLTPAVRDSLRQIESDPDILTSALAMLDHGTVPAASLPISTARSPSSLDLCGTFQQEGSSYRIKSPIWADLLRQRLTPDHIGRANAMAGRWPEAIRFFGQAIQQGYVEARSELYSVVISAIHASEDATEGFTVLGQGLQASHPSSVVRVYDRTEGALRLVHPPTEAQSAKLILLENTRLPEIEALHGPDHSISSDTRLFFPLRIGGMGTQSVGLVSLARFPFPSSPYQRRNEMRLLVRFLRQAAMAIHTKDQLTNLLNITAQRADKLNTLNKILMRILRHGDRRELVVLKLVLAGITSNWGLEFNRAILLMVDEDQRALVGYLAVGHVTRAEAEVDWETFPHPTINDLMDFLVESRDQETPLQRKIQSLSLKLDRQQNKSLLEILRSYAPVRSVDLPDRAILPRALVRAVDPPADFAFVPLAAGDHALGILYVDDKFTGRAISDERFELLHAFTSQAALVLENLRTLEAAREELQQARDRELRERTATLATGLIHDINSAVASIPDLVVEIEDKLKVGRDVTAPLADLKRSAEQSGKIASRLHDFVITGQFSATWNDLDPLIRNAIEDVSDQKPDQVSINYQSRGLNPTVRVDGLWIELLIQNLLLNAYAAIPPEREGRIDIEVELEPESVLIRVRDNGIGIPERDRSRIFEPGFTTKPEVGRLHGIGLYHCRLIAEEHDGLLSVSSTPGAGTQFTVKLPRASQRVDSA